MTFKIEAEYSLSNGSVAGLRQCIETGHFRGVDANLLAETIIKAAKASSTGTVRVTIEPTAPTQEGK